MILTFIIYESQGMRTEYVSPLGQWDLEVGGGDGISI